MRDHHNPNRIHSVDDDRPDSDGWNWDWYSDLTDGKHKTWGFTTARKFENINFVAKNDHPGFWRRFGNWLIDG